MDLAMLAWELQHRCLLCNQGWSFMLCRAALAHSAALERVSDSRSWPCKRIVVVSLDKKWVCSGSNMAASVKQLTLVMLHCGEQILLGMKKRGFGAGKINVRLIHISSTQNSHRRAHFSHRVLGAKWKSENRFMTQR
jgi:hypothetical protein